MAIKTKNFEHNKVEKCNLSHEFINTEVERYAIILDCDGDKIGSIGFYKSHLLKELITGNMKEVHKVVAKNTESKIIQMSRGMLQKVGLVP